MITITVEWSDPHHPADGYNMIASHLAAGYDEGPLLVVPAVSRSGPGHGPEALMFEDVSAYLAHVMEHGDELKDDRWVGLVRSIEGGDRSHGRAAIYHLKQLLGPRRPNRRRPGRMAGAKPLDYAVLPGPFVSDVDIIVENIGDGFRYGIAEAFPALTETMEFSSEEEW